MTESNDYPVGRFVLQMGRERDHAEELLMEAMRVLSEARELVALLDDRPKDQATAKAMLATLDHIDDLNLRVRDRYPTQPDKPRPLSARELDGQLSTVIGEHHQAQHEIGQLKKRIAELEGRPRPNEREW